MSDLIQEFLQQRAAKDVSGSSLELLGKKAAAKWQCGGARTLNDAVVETVKHATLSPEQVRRVVEFTNVDAYLQEFRKEGAGHKVIDFGEGGPASPAAVLQDLNDGGGGTVFDRGLADYSSAPEEKLSFSQKDYRDFEQMWKVAAPDIPEVDPFGGAYALWEKLSSEHGHLNAQVSGLEVAHDDVLHKLYGEVKEAAVSGHSLSEIANIWSAVAPDDIFVKTAFRRMYQPLMRDGVFDDRTLVQSMGKVASVRVANPDHPLVQHFQDYCNILSKLAEVRDERDEVGEAAGEMLVFLKAAADDAFTSEVRGAGKKGLERAGQLVAKGNLLGTAWDAGKRGLNSLSQLGERAGQTIGGDIGSAVGHYALPGAAIVGTGLALNEARRAALATRPGAAVGRGFQRLHAAIPGTVAYNRRQAQLDYELAMSQQNAAAGYQ